MRHLDQIFAASSGRSPRSTGPCCVPESPRAVNGCVAVEDQQEGST